ncbi:hypothetical protein BDN72DRAFT_872475 [Pluteus cervinus]|uniref:Uncharacterized protein n=1 Tax=Pluteus cervinus TaxID=181527 RepID=A0ACD3AAD1_9AGAR|nr:hypothetical protein BDN72DRAFT_872475 [Pluteus cervinus]
MTLIHAVRDEGTIIGCPSSMCLQRRLDHLDEVQVSPTEVAKACSYLRLAIKFFPNEATRQDEIKEHIETMIGQSGQWGTPWADSIKPGGSWWYNDFLTLVLELKNSLAIIVYSKIVSQDKYKPYRNSCNFPLVLIGVTANRLEVSTAVCIGRIYVTRLVVLDFSLGFHASADIIRLARAFKAVRTCREDLQDYYSSIINAPSSELSSVYPNPTLIDYSKILPILTYRRFLSREGQPTSTLVNLGTVSSALYIATMEGVPNEVVVKFTARYNPTAHELLAEARLAPKLHFWGRVIGDLYMVVMDRVHGKTVLQLQQDETPVPKIVWENVHKAVELLHTKDIVFGDLRPPNILYLESENRAVLVDFDWPAKHEEGRYPASINTLNAWAEGVSAYSRMRKEHDTWQLVQLKAICGVDDRVAIPSDV